jgi:hypothetical protein
MLETTNRFFQRAADHLELDEQLRDILLTPIRRTGVTHEHLRSSFNANNNAAHRKPIPVYVLWSSIVASRKSIR